MHTHPFNDPFTWSTPTHLIIPSHGVDYFMQTHPINDPFTWSSLVNVHPPI